MEIAKLFSFSEALKIRQKQKNVVLTNGCFDLLHPGHIASLTYAAHYGNLWVALDSDQNVKILKGTSRPVMNEKERAYMLSALECVFGIFIFGPGELAAKIEQFHPDVYVKSADYNLETLNPNERLMLQKIGAKIEFAPLSPGMSTTQLIQKIQHLEIRQQ